MVICKMCAFGKGRCGMRSRVVSSGGNECELFVKKGMASKPKKIVAKQSWPTEKGILVTIVKTNGKKEISLQKKK